MSVGLPPVTGRPHHPRRGARRIHPGRAGVNVAVHDHRARLGELTPYQGSRILKMVLLVVRRLSAVTLCLALLAGNAAVCAGWMPTPEARMACCAAEAQCPMHRSGSPDSAAGRELTQAQADACCASSDREESNPSSPPFAAAISFAVLGPGVAVPLNRPALVLSDSWRTGSPVPSAPIPKHVLLSVFLV